MIRNFMIEAFIVVTILVIVIAIAVNVLLEYAEYKKSKNSRF